MIDSTTKKQIVAVQKENQISIKVYSWSDLDRLEEYLEDKLQIEVVSFKSLEDENGNEIGSEIFLPNVHSVQLIQDTIDEIE